jgi:hypothetical protein
MIRALSPAEQASRGLSRCLADLADRAATIHGPEAYAVGTAEHPVFGRFWVVAGNGHRFITTNEGDAATLRAAFDLIREVAGR